MPVPNFRSPQRLAAHANRTGSHFFSPQTMRFFRSILHDALRSQDGVYLVIVSNQYEYSTGELGDRAYRIVEVIPGETSTEVGYRNGDNYPTYEDAIEALNTITVA